MPPRVPCPQGRSTLTLCFRPAARPAGTSLLQPLIQMASLSMKEKKRKAKQDPYWWEQSQRRIAANKQRQAELKVVRDVEWGHKIHGITTPFVESLDSAGQEQTSAPVMDAEGNVLEHPHALPTSPDLLNFQLSKTELDEAIMNAYELTKPVELDLKGSNTDGPVDDVYSRAHAAEHEKAVTALHRIASLEHANGKDRRHVNIRRCIETFGRHNTDAFLRPKPKALGANPPEPVPRAGPDTGSSEVQIAILTAKIRVLSQMYDGYKGNKDKHNKRNLKLLLHRRQRLLRYMERKERGSERWTHMLKTLGLTPATWKEQITVE